MKRLIEYRSIDNEIKKLRERMEKLEQNDRFISEMAFEEDLMSIMHKHDKTVKDLLDILDLKAVPAKRKTA